MSLFLRMVHEVRATTHCVLKQTRRERKAARKAQRESQRPLTPPDFYAHAKRASNENTSNETSVPNKGKEELFFEKLKKFVASSMEPEEREAMQAYLSAHLEANQKEFSEFDSTVPDESFPSLHGELIDQRNALHVRICYNISQEARHMSSDPTGFCRKIRAAILVSSNTPHRKESIEIYRDDVDDIR